MITSSKITRLHDEKQFTGQNLLGIQERERLLKEPPSNYYMMSTLNLNKNSFTVDTSIWEAINDCNCLIRKKRIGGICSQKLKLEFHGDFPNQTENFSELNLPKLTGPVIVIENGKLNEKLSSIPNHKSQLSLLKMMIFHLKIFILIV